MIDEKVIPPPTYVSQQSSQPQLVSGSAVSYPPPVATAPQPQYPLPQVVPSAVQIGAQYQQQLFARCAQGDHDPTTKYGVCGIITAVFLFPIGLICLFADTETRCARCGVMIP